MRVVDNLSYASELESYLNHILCIWTWIISETIVAVFTLYTMNWF